MSDDYGVIAESSGHNIYAHRFAWQQATGDVLTSDDVICHTCDNPPCTRNDDEGWYEVNGLTYPRRGHLFKATDAVNAADMHQKGRQRPTTLHGERHPSAKLTEAEVRAIRANSAQGIDARTLAAQHDVTPTLIRAIVARRVWKHVV